MRKPHMQTIKTKQLPQQRGLLYLQSYKMTNSEQACIWRWVSHISQHYLGPQIKRLGNSMKTFSLDSQQFRKTGTSSTSTMFHCYTKICNTVILYKRYPHIQESWLHTSTQRLAILTEAFHGIVQCKTKYKRFSSNTSITFMKYSLSYMFRPQLGPKHVAE